MCNKLWKWSPVILATLFMVMDGMFITELSWREGLAQITTTAALSVIVQIVPVKRGAANA